MANALELSIGEDALEKLNDALENGVSTELRSMLNSLPAADSAHLLESSPPKLRSLLWRLIDREQEGYVLQELSDEVRHFFLNRMNIAELKSILDGKDVDDIADLLQQLPDTITRKVLDSMDYQDRQRVEEVLVYPEDSAGGLMNVDTITVRSDVTVDVVLRYLRQHKNIPKNTDSILVVNRNNQYIGILPITLLLSTDAENMVSNILLKDIKPIEANMKSSQVALLFERQDLVSAPVVDKNGKLLGRITIDDVVDVIREDAEHSMMSMAGLDDDEDTFAAPLKTARRRAVWLGINLVTAFIAASVIGFFQETINHLVALAVLMPIVAGMGGNAGSQTLTLVVRGMALGQISKNNLRWLISREFISGLLNGLLWGVIIGIISWLWFQNIKVSIIICCAITINLSMAVIVGAYLPVVLKSFGIDPALAGSILLTTITDVIGFFSFLGLASVFI
jgi:magnesium transporter